MLLEIYGKTDVGKKRSNNEDNFMVDQTTNLYVVADGMGGHNSGEVASKMAVEVLERYIKHAMFPEIDSDKTQVTSSNALSYNPASLAEHLKAGIELANQAIFEASKNYAQNQGMGTTVVAVIAQEKSYIIAWVGDSRIYLVRHGRIQQLTSDHSLVQEQMNKGLISEKEAENSEFKNILTRALGTSEHIEVDIAEIPAFDDDYLILCTDGLSKIISDRNMLEIVEKSQLPQDICEKLIEAANNSGGPDNITAITIYRKSTGLMDKLFKFIGKIN